jgi:exodeoxyribonuclease VII small subunit
MPETSKDFENQLARLQEIVTSLEQGDLPLEKGIALFKEGTELARSCRQQLKEARHKVQVYSQGLLQDFDPQEPQEDDRKTDEEHS